MNDTSKSEHKARTMILTEVPSGKTCKLIGVVRRRGWGGHRQGRHGHSKSTFLDEFKERWEERKKKHHWDHWSERREFDPESESMTIPHWGGRRTLRRLLDLGITKGCSFLVIQGSATGPVLVQVRGTRVALGQGLASKILVEILD